MNFMFEWREQYLEHKIHIFSPACNMLYMYRLQRDTYNIFVYILFSNIFKCYKKNFQGYKKSEEIKV